MSRVYGLIASAYAQAMATRWGYYLLSKVFPAVFFVWFLLLGAPSVVAQAYVVFSRPGMNPVELLVWFNATAGWFFFSGLLAALYVVRKPLAGRPASLKGAAVALAGTYIGSLGAGAAAATPPEWVAIVAGGLAVVGLWLFGVSIVCLGRCFGIFPEARGLVTFGPYSTVRHPVYLSEMVMGLSAVLNSLDLWVAGLYVLFVLLQYRRALYEEQALAQAFPAAYAAYCARTPWRLLPGLI